MYVLSKFSNLQMPISSHFTRSVFLYLYRKTNVNKKQTNRTIKEEYKNMAIIPFKDVLTTWSDTISKALRIKGEHVITDGTDDTKIMEVNDDGSINTKLSGSNMELYGASINDRPAANTVPAGATFTIVDENLDQNWISDGTNWKEV
jgi:hypothetical protein